MPQSKSETKQVPFRLGEIDIHTLDRLVIFLARKGTKVSRNGALKYLLHYTRENILRNPQKKS